MKEETARHLSLDLWLTLIRSNKAFKPTRNTLFVKAFDLQQWPEEAVLTTFQEYDRLFNSINESTGRNLSRYEMLYIILAALGKDVGAIPKDALDDFFAEADMLFFRYPPELLDEKVIAALQALRISGITVSLLSNTGFITGTVLRKLLPQIGFEAVFDFQIYSDEEEHSKPSPQIFNTLYQQAAQLQPLTRKQLLHIGDNAVADYNGAISAGLSAALFDPSKQRLRDIFPKILCTPLLHSTT